MANLLKKAEKANVSIDVLKDICKEIEEDRIFVISSKDRNKAQFLVRWDSYIGSRTYVLIKLGYLKRGSDDFNCRLNPYCPNQSISDSLALFLSDCISEGIYTGLAKPENLRAKDVRTIWL